MFVTTEETGFSTVSATPNPNRNRKFSERRGLVHLFRSPYAATPSSRSTCLFVVAVPNYFSVDDHPILRLPHQLRPSPHLHRYQLIDLQK